MPRELHCAADTWRSLCDSRERLATWIGGVTEAERNRQVRAGSATGRGVELVLQSIQTLLTGSEAQFRPRVRIPPDPIQPRRCVAVGFCSPPSSSGGGGFSQSGKVSE